MEKLSKSMIWKERIFYFFTNLGNIPIMTLVSSFLAIYYVSTLGMDEIKVGTMFLIARIFDGINDPFIGYFIDRVPQSKFGKFRKVLILGTIICSINYLVLWIGPAYVSEGAKLTVAYISYLLLGCTFPVMDISLNSLLPVMTSDLNERNILASVKMIAIGVGSFAIGIIAPQIVKSMDATKEAYVLICCIFVGIVVVCSIGGVMGVHQRVEFKNENGYKVTELPKILVVNPVLMTFIAGLFFFTGNAFMTAANTYYATYVLGDVGKLSLLSLVQTFASLPPLILSAIASKKWGKKPVYGIGLIIAGIGVLLRLLAMNDSASGLTMGMISSGVFGFGLSFALVLFYSIQADNTDYVEYKLHKRSEGAVSALSSMINKIGNGLGGAFPLYVLAWTKSASGEYSAYGLALTSALIPAIFIIVSGLFFLLFYRLDKDTLDRIQAELKARREAESHV